jgi:uncharacterized RDD family membrane protein YckC
MSEIESNLPIPAHMPTQTSPDRPPSPSIDVPQKSLWAELADGSAGVIVRIIITIAAAFALTAASVLGAYGMSFGSDRRVPDEIFLLCLSIAGIIYFGIILWIWSHQRNKRPIFSALAKTVGLWIVAIIIMILVSEVLPREEPLIFAVFCAGMTVTLIFWVEFYRHYARGRALYDQNGSLDLRCPECNYMMVGLREARCPECGSEFTLDHLFLRQNFQALRQPTVARIGPPE